ncbi:hypothetical protein F5X99DRAFT_432476 [Biscogniauxia marginata]|nr:hypothetical protein F5X99DRAFT_432476 [Biscogniauxia marginata]
MPSRTYNLRSLPSPSPRTQEAGVTPRRRPQKPTRIRLVNYSIDRLAALYRRGQQEEQLRQQEEQPEWQRPQREQQMAEQPSQQQQTCPRLNKIYRAGQLYSIYDMANHDYIYHAVRDADRPILTTYLHGKCVAITDWRGPTPLYVYGVSHQQHT